MLYRLKVKHSPFFFQTKYLLFYIFKQNKIKVYKKQFPRDFGKSAHSNYQLYNYSQVYLLKIISLICFYYIMTLLFSLLEDYSI